MNTKKHTSSVSVVPLLCLLMAALPARAVAQPTEDKSPAADKPAAKTPTTQEVELTKEAAEQESRPRVAYIRLSGSVPESPPNFSLFTDPDRPTLKDWLERLAKARKDKRVQAVALEVSSPSITWAQAQELADAVERLNAVKPVHAYLSGAGASGYLVGSAAKEVAMDPAGTLEVVGLAAEMLFFRGTLDWLEIQPQMIQIGRFKGAAEPFTNTGPSDELQQETKRLMDELYDQLCGQIARQRKLKDPQVRGAIDAGPLAGDAAMKHRLVDRLVERAEWKQHVGASAAGKGKGFTWLKDYGKKPRKTLDLSNPFALLGTLLGGPQKQHISDPSIAIIHADGIIVRGASAQGLFGGKTVGSRTLVKAFDTVTADSRIKAVIFRINSPGGSAMASELIAQAVERCAKKKPVIVSVSQMAASGGYYIAVNGTTLIADASAVVGSIGVISGKLALTGLMKKIGISTFAVTRGRNAGLSLLRPWTEAERAVVRKHAERVYATFTARVARRRGKKIRDVDAVAQGRIFTARQAVKNGLVDRVGGFREAVSAALAAAKLKESAFITLPRPKSFTDLLYGQSETTSPVSVPAERAARALGLEPLPRFVKHPGLTYLLALAELLGEERVLTAMPYYLSVQP